MLSRPWIMLALSMDIGRPLSKGQLRQPQMNCWHLSKIFLSVSKDHNWSAYADFFCSFGWKVSFLSFNNAPVSICEKTVASCPKLHCGIEASEAVGLVQKTNVLGPFLSRISLNLEESVHQLSLEELACALRSCASLKL